MEPDDIVPVPGCTIVERSALEGWDAPTYRDRFRTLKAPYHVVVIGGEYQIKELREVKKAFLEQDYYKRHNRQKSKAIQAFNKGGISKDRLKIPTKE